MDNRSDHYLGERGTRYFENRFDERTAFGRRFQSKYFQPFCSAELRLLDFGCGVGTMLRELPSKSRSGVEVNPAAIRTIRAFNQETKQPITLYKTLNEVPNSSADLVISNHCLEHVPDPLGALKEIHRVLDANGTLVLVVPFDDWRSANNSKWMPANPDNHIFTWSPLNLGNLAVEAGFNVQKSELQTFAWSPKFFFVHKYLGNSVFRVVCWLFSKLKNRREVLCVANKNN